MAKNPPKKIFQRESLELTAADWAALTALAAKTGALYSGRPSWRRLILRIARGEIEVSVIKKLPA